MSRTPDDDGTRKQKRQLARRERRGKEAAASRAASRRRRLRIGGSAAAAVAVVAAVALIVAGSGAGRSPKPAASAPQLPLASLATLGALQPPGASGPLGPERVPLPQAPILAGTGTAASGGAVDGIECNAGEQTLFHIHAPLAIYVDGRARAMPYGIGIPGARAEPILGAPFVTTGDCFYWLHTHAADGIIHIESPVARVYTLGDFFDVWGQPLTRRRVGPARGPVTALYNGRVFEGDPRSIPLNRHAQIQLDVGRPLVGPGTITFPEGL